MLLNGKNIDLDLPVDAYDTEGNLKEKPEGVSAEPSAEASQAKETVIEKKEEEEEQRVPYSRFDKVRKEREEAIREAEEARTLLRELTDARKEVSRETPSSSSYEEDYAREVKKLYGDNSVAQEIINLNLKHQKEMDERAERRALEAIDRRQSSETRALAQNEEVVKSRLEELTEKIGRELTENEEDAVLDIVDEYTPTGEDGKYLGEILSFDKAWEVYELRQQKQASTSKRSRSAALIAGSSRSQGEPSDSSTAEQNKNFNPRNWSSLYDRLK